jgi:uncharacterized protein (TIGR02217 family)
MAFLEDVVFPQNVSTGSGGGPGFRNTIVVGGAGIEQRIVHWQTARARYRVGYGMKSWADLTAVLALFRNAQGRAHGFRYRDPLDHRITGQIIGAGDGATTAFQIVKDYAVAGQVYRRTIAKPVPGTLAVSLDGAPQGGDWSVETATGIITFAAPPGHGVAVSVNCQFHVPVRFDHDELQINLASFNVGEAPDITLIELRGE